MNHSGPDRWLLLSSLALLATGVVMVYSASAVAAAQQYGDARHFLDRQLLFAAAALILMAIAACIPPDFWHRHALWLYLLAGIALVAVLIPGLGLKIGGARRWLSSGEWRRNSLASRWSACCRGCWQHGSVGDKKEWPASRLSRRWF